MSSMKVKIYYLTILFLLIGIVKAQTQGNIPDFSKAGFYEIQESNRTVYNFNVGWRFDKGSDDRAGEIQFDDSSWEIVSLPHGLEYLPVDAAGSINYLGEVWYRKYFTPENDLKGKHIFLHFEAIMGKSEIWINGNLLKKHYGGYLPVVVDITDGLLWDKENIITIKADNSDDPNFPPGKKH